MSKTFLITSHTEGLFTAEQQILLHSLVSALKQFFPDCFLLISSQSAVNYETQKLADYVIVDRATANVPYGNGELHLVKAGLERLQQFGRTDCIKMVYDFVIDKSNWSIFDQWIAHQKPFVGCYWKTQGLGVGSWIWYGTLQMQQQILNFESLDLLLEHKILQSIDQQNLWEHCFLYEDNEHMFNGQWFDKCDLVHAGGTRLKFDYGSISTLLHLSDQTQSIAPVQLYAIAAQIKKPSHVILVDSRSNKQDLRHVQLYQHLFDLLSANGISWSLIYYQNNSQTLKYVQQLAYQWCWVIEDQALIQSNSLNQLWTNVVSNPHSNLQLAQSHWLFRPKNIEVDQVTVDLKSQVIDKINQSVYN